MPGPPSVGPSRITLDVKGDVPDWKEAFKQFLLTVKDSDGYFRYRWGPWEEDRGKLEIMATWAPLEKRQAFGKSEHHQRAIDALKPVLKSMPSKCPRHDLDVRHFVPPPPQLLESPVSEVITIRSCTGNPEAMAATLKKAEANKGCIASHAGLASVDDPVYGTVWIGFIGWENLDASKSADTAAHTPTGVGEVERHHINFNFPIKGFSVTNPGR
ncbi:Dimeric alpha-beta barrel [Ophiocordyceps sinensis CO18]|uniref:Dimeric alpha-beta barrel n=1 Tax=Ophiocordyceps sinensis (strain Co18 / CGMCC 3.14243) TaxID=911162 RepID=T5AD09_OPHSC|nr:Dimeric alpha-beta barrel [Ophiocordyceps sinensis CO18]